MTVRPPPDYDPRAFPPVAVTVDLAVFTVRDDALRVLLVQRGEEPFRGAWALPGGFVKPNETPEEAARRELEEETGIAVGFLDQLRAYGDPRRDPRMRVVTLAFWAVAAKLPDPRGGSDAARAELVPVQDLEEGKLWLAFDHDLIVRDAVARIRERLEEPTLAAAFCSPEFTISELRRVYEAVWRTPMNPANFQRLVRRSRLFRPAEAKAPPGSLGGRPASTWSPIASIGSGPSFHRAALVRAEPPAKPPRPPKRRKRAKRPKRLPDAVGPPERGSGDPDPTAVGASPPSAPPPEAPRRQRPVRFVPPSPRRARSDSDRELPPRRPEAESDEG